MKTKRVNGRTAWASSRVYAGEEVGGERCGFEKKQGRKTINIYRRYYIKYS
jgi:hypothetical protein